MMREAAFTLASVVLLLVNVAAIGTSGRERAKRVVCLANLKQLTSAWNLYADQNDGKIVNNNFTNLSLLLKAGYNAVKACNSGTQVILHIDKGGNNSTSRWWFDGVKAKGVNWDITGLSYYCFWHGSLSAMQSNVADLKSRYGKPVVIVETAYPFTASNADSEPNVVTGSAPCSGYSATWSGQASNFSAVQSAARNGGATWEERIRTAMKKWVGAYSLVILTRDCVYAVRDPWGFRPLCIGLLPSGGHAVASETGALQTLGCETIRDVKPGEVVSLSNNALKVMQALPSVTPSAMCVFEHIYFIKQLSLTIHRHLTYSFHIWDLPKNSRLPLLVKYF